MKEERKTKRRAVVSFPFLKKKKKKKRNRKKEDVYHLKSYTNSSTGCVILSSLVISFLMLMFGARSICLDGIYIQTRVQNEDAFDDFLFFFVFVWTTINLNTFPRRA